MLPLLRFLVPLLGIYMTYVAVATSLESNLFEVWPELAEIPWMVATLQDFYINIALIYFWVWYKETHWGSRLLWLVLFLCLGAIATCLYLTLQLYKVPADAAVSEVLLRAKRPER